MIPADWPETALEELAEFQVGPMPGMSFHDPPGVLRRRWWPSGSRGSWRL